MAAVFTAVSSVKRQTVKIIVLAINAFQSQTSVTFSRKNIFMDKRMHAIKPKQLSNHFTELSPGISKQLFSRDLKYCSRLRSSVLQTTI